VPAVPIKILSVLAGSDGQPRPAAAPLPIRVKDYRPVAAAGLVLLWLALALALRLLRRSLPAAAIAQERGAPLSSNLALLGYFSAFGEGPIPHDEMRETVERISPERFREMNLAIFDAGCEKAKGEGNV
jgi:hypothetical protein